MRGLSKARPVFHSEVDFQFALSRRIDVEIPDCKVRLEKTFRFEEGKSRVDIWLPGEGVAIELKYFTRQMAVCHADEWYDLKEHAATDLARHGFLTDVQRLERLVQGEEHPVSVGFAVLLTNAPTLWEPSRRITNDAAFHLYEDRDGVTGKLQWTKQGRPIEDGGLHLKGAYAMAWKPFSHFESVGAEFRYLAVAVR